MINKKNEKNERNEDNERKAEGLNWLRIGLQPYQSKTPPTHIP